jgi:hypothetical protein
MNKLETLHAPHGIEPYVCPRCFAEFHALFLFNKHVREKHPQEKQAAVAKSIGQQPDQPNQPNQQPRS